MEKTNTVGLLNTSTLNMTSSVWVSNPENDKIPNHQLCLEWVLNKVPPWVSMMISFCLNSDWGRVIESWIIWGKFLKYKAAEQRSLSLSCALCWYWYCVSILLSISISHLNKDSEDGTHPSSLNSWASHHPQINGAAGKLNLWSTESSQTPPSPSEIINSMYDVIQATKI